VTKTVHVPDCPGPVNPPVANFNYLSQCPDSKNVQFTDTSTGYPTSWSWNFGDGLTSTLQSPAHTYTSIGDYTVTLTATNSAGSNTVTKTVHVPDCPGPGGKPVANFNYLSQCPNPRYVEFTDTSTGNPTSWYWSFGDDDYSSLQNPTHTYFSYGTYQVTLTVTNEYGSSTTYRNVKIDPCTGPVEPPVADFTYLSQCPDSRNVQFTDASAKSPTSWSWSFGDGQTSTLQNPAYTYASIGDYTVTLTATNSAGSNTVTKTVHVPDCPGPVNPPVANFNYLSQCPNSKNVQFTDTSTGVPTSWSWNFGDEQTSTLQSPTHTYSSIGDYTVTLTATNSAGSNTVTKTVHVPDCPGPGTPPVANFNYVAQCPNPLYAEFTDTSTGNPTSWSWSFGDGQTSTLQNPTHTYPGVGGYEITLTVSNAYGSSSISKVLCISCITCPPVANFTFVSQCPNPLNVQFTDTSSKIATEGPTSWSWQFGDGQTSTLQNPTHTYAALGDYTVTLTATNSAGSNSISKTVHISPCVPEANFTYISQCPNPLNVQFNDTTSAIVTEKPTTWSWNFGDGQTSTLQNPTHTYAVIGDYNVTLTASNAAGSSTVSKIVHLPTCAPEANFTIRAECPNPLFAQFTDTSTGNPTSWSWQFGDGQTSTLQNPSHTYSTVGAFEITLTASNAGGSSSISKVLCISCITCPPVANFTFVSECPNPLYVQFTDTSSTIATEVPTSWSWQFGDGQTSTLQNPTHTYAALGDYNVTLTASNAGGSHSISRTVHIASCSPAADFSFVTQCPNPLNVQFTDTSSTIISEKPTAWSWNFGDGQTSTLQNPAHTFAALGDYNVTLTASNSAGSSTVSKAVHIAPCSPAADFSFVTQCPNPLNVQFTDTSSTIISEKPTAWSWTFGDGQTSTLQNPTHTYAAMGDYNVTLTASNAAGSSTVSKTVHIGPCPPVVDFTYLSECPNPLYVQFTDASSQIITERPTSWSWNFGDGTTSTFQNPAHTYAAYGDYNVTLTATNAAGSRSVSKTVHIVKCPDPPIACFWTYPQTGTAPLEVEFCDCSKTDILTWFWDFGDGNTSTQSQPIHIYYQPGSYTVSLTVTNATGTDTEIQPDYVVVTSPPQSPPRAYFTTNKNIGAVPLTITFTDLSSGIPDSWLWNFGDGATSTERNPVHVYTQPGYYTVSLEVKNSLGSSTYTTSSGYIKALSV
jgi:PKD repeat protein